MSKQADFIEKARTLLTGAGILYEPLDCSGEMAYRGTTRKPHGTDGRYKMHMDFPPTLWLCNYHEGGEGQTFKLYEKAELDAMSEVDKKALRERIRQEKEAGQKRREERAQEAAREAEEIFSGLPLAMQDNAYLSRKGVLPLGDMREEPDGRLVLPMLNSAGEIVSLQHIAGDSEKRFLSGGEKRGCFFPIPAHDGGKSGPLLIGEGVATVLSCCMATGYAGLVAFDAGNLLPVAQMARAQYPDRVIIICADNDCTDKKGNPRPKEKNTGVLKAIEAAQAIGAKLAVCPAIRGRKADFNDLFTDTEDGPERVRVVIEKAMREEAESEWEEPIPFSGMNLPKLDAAQLPQLLRDFCEGVAEEKQVPLELPVAMTLAALAAVAQNRFVVEVRRGYRESMNIYTLCPLEPGNRKSAVAEVCSAPIVEWEKEMALAVGEEVRAARSARATIEKAIEGKRKKAEKMHDRGELEALQASIRELEQSLPEVPHIPRLLADNVTPEGLAYLLSQLGVGMAILSAEGGLFDILGGMYSKGTPNLDLFLKAHNGEAFRVDRRGADPIILNRPCLTLGISPQPVTLAEREASTIFRRRGLDGRFLYFMPKSLLGRRKLEPELMPEKIKERFRRKVRSMLPAKGQDAAGDMLVLKLSKDAYAVWLDFSEAVEKELDKGGDFDGMSDWGGKLAGAVARIAGLFHVAEHDQPERWPVSAETMGRAVYLGSFLTEHAKAAYCLMGTNDTIEGAKVVLEWIRGKALEHFTERDCQQAKKNNKLLEDKEKRKKALDELEDRGYIRKLPEVKPTAGRPPSPTYAVNPATLRG